MFKNELSQTQDFLPLRRKTIVKCKKTFQTSFYVRNIKQLIFLLVTLLYSWKTVFNGWGKLRDDLLRRFAEVGAVAQCQSHPLPSRMPVPQHGWCLQSHFRSSWGDGTPEQHMLIRAGMSWGTEPKDRTAPYGNDSFSFSFSSNCIHQVGWTLASVGLNTWDT